MSITREQAKDMVGEGWSKLVDKIYDAAPTDLVVTQVKEKFGCYDSDTEILTENGWKYFKHLSYNDKIATLENQEYIKYYTPINICEYDYKGKMYELETRGVSLCVTPNHKLYIAEPDKLNGRYKPYKRTEQNFKLQTYENLYLKNKKFKKNALWEGVECEHFTIPGYTYTRNTPIRLYTIPDKTYKMDDFLNFLGWFVSEGCASTKGDISIACCNTDDGKERETISECIKNLGYEIKTSMEDRSAFVFRIYNKQLSNWLLDNCGHLAHNKKIPTFIQNLSSRQIKIFVSSLYSGDGHKAKTSHTLTTVSKSLSDDIQILILKIGETFRGRSRKRHSSYVKSGIYRNIYEINRMSKKYHNTREKGLSKSSREGLYDYEGKVYCVEVPNNIIYIRRNGKGIWCGNSLRFYYSNATSMFDDIVDEVEKESSYICDQCGKEGENKQMNGWYSTLCYECREELRDRLAKEYKDFTEKGI